MRPVVRAETPLEWLLLRLGLVPTPLLDGYWGMTISRSLITAVELELFEALGDGPLSAAELSDRLGTDRHGTEILLKALNGARYLSCRNGRYSNGRVVHRWLVDGALVHLRDSLLFYGDLWDVMSDLTSMVRSGAVTNLHYEGRPAEFWQRYLRALAAFAPLVAPEIVSKSKLPRNARRVLDVGGGHGLYAAEFVRRRPGLSAEVLDLPEACAVGRQIIEAAGLTDRVHFREGDVRDCDWGTGFDAVLLFNLLHNLTESESRAALHGAFAALRPGGKVIVLDSEYQSSAGNLSLTAGLNEMMFYLTSGTGVYPEERMRSWIAEAGFGRIRMRHLLRMPMAVLIEATRGLAK
ncbi:MAG: class I SAM-dependent methyltransferase [Actinobacteria bacterium]|nr:class I SAM-dependent methyltransferase [Actinomycetota bacterium]